MNQTVNLSVERSKLSRQLAELRDKRGAALLDGVAFDETQIASVESSLRALDDAETVTEKRARTAYKVDRRKIHQENVATYAASREQRLAATAEAESAVRSLAAALKKIDEHGAAEEAAALALGASEGSLRPENRQMRLWAYLKATLEHGLGARFFAGVDLDPGSMGVPGSANWRDSEAALGDLSTHFARSAPAE